MKRDDTIGLEHSASLQNNYSHPMRIVCERDSYTIEKAVLYEKAADSEPSRFDFLFPGQQESSLKQDAA